MEFTPNISPPMVTAQERRVTIQNGRPRVYEGVKLKVARNQFLLAPEEPLEGPVALTVIT